MNKHYGSVFANSDLKPLNAYGWGIQFRKGSFQNFLAKHFGVFHLGARIRNRILKKILDDYDFSQKILFDAGCGVGLSSFYVSPRFKKIVGVDIDPAKIRQAKILARKNSVSNIDFKVADLLDSGVFKNTFDAVICLEVMEHVSDDRKLIATLDKLLAKDGMLIFSFPSKTLLSSIAQKSLDHYKVGYNLDDIKKLLKGSELKVVEAHPFGKSILGKIVITVDFIFRKTIPFLASVFFPIFYPLIIIDGYLPTFGIPRGYLWVLKKKVT